VSRPRTTRDIERDPFHEDRALPLSWRTHVLGAPCVFRSDSRELLGIAREAFAGVPRHAWPRGGSRALSVSLERVREKAPPAWKTPAAPVLSSAGGLLFAHFDPRNFVVIDPGAGRAVARVSDSLLRHPRLLRYEVIEFAAITLASRTQGLVPLHAGCVGARGRGVLLLGSSGSGKSTLALHAALAGLEYLAEDSVFVQPASLSATGLSAFVHARAESLGLIGDARARRGLGRAPTIQRRSGARKLEIDLRRGGVRLARSPLRIVATIVLSARRANGAARLAPIQRAQFRRALRAEQPYATSQPGWREFERGILLAGGYGLGRVPPTDAVDAVRTLLSGGTTRP
jgi:hypothetical protein